MSLTMKRIRELDAIKDREVRKFLTLGVAYGSPHPLFLQERCIDAVDLPKMAKKWGIPGQEDELRSYIALQRYIDGFAQGYEVPFPTDIVYALKISIGEREEFVDYVHEQARKIREALASDEADFAPPWGDAIHEDLAFEEDLIDEAGRRGFSE